MTADIDDGDIDPATLLAGNDLVVVSNRQPYTFEYDDEGEVRVDSPAGGLTAGLDPALQRTGGTWIAWGAGEADDEVIDEDGRVRVPPDDPAYDLDLLALSPDEVDGYYYGYSNQVLWPLCHGGIWQTEFAEWNWEYYQSVNRSFADAVIERADDDTVVWFQDYHLARAPPHVRAADPDPFLMHFWHIPWPGWETFRSLPYHQTLLSGLLGNDLIGFHTDDYRADFLDCVARGLDDARVDRHAGTVKYLGRTITVRSFPLGVDAGAIAETAAAVDRRGRSELAERYGIPSTGLVGLGVDRLDYTKGIPERIEALERLWQERPEWQEALTFVQKVDESRSRIPSYQDLQRRVDTAIERVNDRFGTPDWTPIVLIDDFLTREELIALYRLGDVMLVSPLRDGMNLVAKEYIAAHVEGDGVLVLSDQTGAHLQLGEDAVSINPHNTEAFAAAIETALTLPPAERRNRMARLRERVEAEDLDWWLGAVLETALELRETHEPVADD